MESGHILISDYGNNSVHIFGKNGKFLSSFGDRGIAFIAFEINNNMSVSH